MKLFFNLDEMKTIRDALYLGVNSLEKEMKEQEMKGLVKEICDEGLAMHRKILLYLNEQIEKETT